MKMRETSRGKDKKPCDNNYLTWANQVRILKMNFQELAGVIGGVLVNAFKPVVKAVNAAMGAIIAFAKTISNALGKIFGWTYEEGGGGLTQDFEGAAGAANDISDGMGGAAKKAKELKTHLLSIDELNVVEPEEASEGGAGGAGGGGALSGAEAGGEWVRGESILKAFESEIDSLYKLGAHIGKVLTDVMEDIPWDKVYEKARNFGKGLADFLNGLISPELFGEIGKSIAGALNVAIYSAMSFGEQFDWTNFGESIAEGVNKFFETFDFESLSNALALWINGFLESMVAFVEKTDWKLIGEKIISSLLSFFEGIDWGGVGKTLSTFATSIFDFLSGLIDGVEWGELPQKILDSIKDFFDGFDYEGTFSSVGNLVGEVIAAHIDILKALQKSGINKGREIYNYFLGYFKESLSGIGEDATWFEIANAMIEGLFNGIIDRIKGINEWIYEHIIAPFVSGFKEGFGIHSPSTVMAELGRNLIDGLLLGIQEIWETLKGWFSTTFEELLLFFEEKWTAIKENAEKIWTLLKESLFKAWENIKKTAAEKFDALKLKLESVWNSIKETIDSKVKNIKDKVTELMEKFTSFKTDAAEAFANIKNSIVNSLSPIIDKLKIFVQWTKDAVSAVKDFFSSGYEKISSKVGEALNRGEKYSETAKRVASNAQGSLIPDVPALATGGIVYKQTFAQIGEAGMEGILPLTNREAMRQMVAQITDYGMSETNNGVLGNVNMGKEIRDGIKEAVSEMLIPYLQDISQSARETADKDMSVNIGDRDIVESYDRGRRRMGWNFQAT